MGFVYFNNQIATGFNCGRYMPSLNMVTPMKIKHWTVFTVNLHKCASDCWRGNQKNNGKCVKREEPQASKSPVISGTSNHASDFKNSLLYL